jgi:hypothetical protein
VRRTADLRKIGALILRVGHKPARNDRRDQYSFLASTGPKPAACAHEFFVLERQQ